MGHLQERKKVTENSRYIYQIEFDKARFQHDVACEILSICLE